MRIGIVGSGYVGLVTGAVLAELGHEVLCSDTDTKKIGMLRKAAVPFFEPGLQDLVKKNTKEGRLFFTNNIKQCTEWGDIVFICVGTPPMASGEPDLGAFWEAATEIAGGLSRQKIIAIKSATPVGTSVRLTAFLREKQASVVDFDVVSTPAFLREGTAIYDMYYADRVVIGSPSIQVSMKIIDLFGDLNCPMFVTDAASAEMIKYASGAFLATKMSFINGISQLCEMYGANVDHVSEGLGADKRIGAEFLKAGLGWGGPSFSKEIAAILHMAEHCGLDFSMLDKVREINKNQTKNFMDRLYEELRGLNGRNIGILGLAFKPNTDNLRDSKSIEIISSLLADGANVSAYDPVAMQRCKKVFPQVSYGRNAYEVAKGADALIVITEWEEFKKLDFKKIKSLMTYPLVFDGRNMFNPDELAMLGIDYHSVGRPHQKPLNV